MGITKILQPIEGIIYRTEGYGKKEKKVALYVIKIPEQKLVYNLVEDAFEDRPIKIIVRTCDERGMMESEQFEGDWPIQTFTDFVEGVKAVTEIARPYIKDNPDLEAEAMITETTYVWSKYVSEQVKGGVFSKSEYEALQQVSFRILGSWPRYVRWEPDMLAAFEKIRDEIVRQRDVFMEQIRIVKEKS
jgi:hypothetical protein